jgi:hypothetical protein
MKRAWCRCFLLPPLILFVLSLLNFQRRADTPSMLKKIMEDDAIEKQTFGAPCLSFLVSSSQFSFLTSLRRSPDTGVPHGCRFLRQHETS